MINADMFRGRGRSTHSPDRGRGRSSRGRHSGAYINYNSDYTTPHRRNNIPDIPGNQFQTGSPSNNMVIEFGNKKLIAMKNKNSEIITADDEKEFQIWKTMQKQNKIAPSFRKVVNDTIDEKEKMVKNQMERNILLLNNADRQWEENPWFLNERYLSNNQYPTETYKSRFYYEQILIANGCEIRHFKSEPNSEIYNFSKINIQRIISMEEWGITPSKEKTLSHVKGNISYNYWDYTQAFDKVFLYQNPNKSHTWLIKIYPDIYNQIIPIWLIEWWQFYGTSEEILPPIFMDLYKQWVDTIPKTPEDDIPGILPMSFFIEFSIPWIWKFQVKTGYNENKLFCLKRESFTRFWETMLRQDKESKKINCQFTIDLIQDKLDNYLLNNNEEEEDDNGDTQFCIHDKTEKEIMEHFTSLAKKAIAKKELMNEDNKSSNSDTSMATSCRSKNKFADIQDLESDDYLTKIIAGGRE